MVNFNQEGLLVPGIHPYNIIDLRSQFVAGFPYSSSRALIWERFLSFVEIIVNTFGEYSPLEAWIDGSFVTDKEEPNDIDIVFHFSLASWNQYNGDIGDIWEDIRNIGLTSFMTDSYWAVQVNNETENYSNVVNMRNYWRGQFGFDRGNRPKGFLAVSMNDIIESAREVGLNE